MKRFLATRTWKQWAALSVGAAFLILVAINEYLTFGIGRALMLLTAYMVIFFLGVTTAYRSSK